MKYLDVQKNSAECYIADNDKYMEVFHWFSTIYINTVINSAN